MERRTVGDTLREGTHAASDVLMALGIALVILGILAIIAPLASGVVFNLLFGTLLIGAGLVELIDTFSSSSWQRGALLALAGLVTLAAGILFIARPIVGLVALTVVFIGYLLFVGVFRIVAAFGSPRGTPGKGMAFVSGVVAIVLAYFGITRLPDVSLWLIGTFVGVSLIFAGVARISAARGIRKATAVLGTAQPTGGAHG